MATKKQPLRNTVQTYRNEARKKLRQLKMNNALQDLFFDKQRVETVKTDIAMMEKKIAIDTYELSKLDKKDPRYEDKKKDLEESKKYHEKELEYRKEQLESVQKEVAKTEEYIAKIEAGEIKVDINEVKRLTTEMILK